MKIMVVDDDPGIIFVLKSILKDEGHEVIPAYSGKECLEKLEEVTPDLIFLDIMMPGLDGWAVLREIKSNEKLKSIHVSMLTTKGLVPSVLEKEEIDDLVDYIVKPFTKESIIKRLENIQDTQDRIDDIKSRLIEIDEKLADEYDRIFKAEKLHKSLLNTLLEVNKKKGMKGTDAVIQNERRLVQIYERRRREIEKLVQR